MRKLKVYLPTIFLWVTLIAFTAYTLLDTFVITRVYTVVAAESSTNGSSADQTTGSQTGSSTTNDNTSDTDQAAATNSTDSSKASNTTGTDQADDINNSGAAGSNDNTGTPVTTATTYQDDNITITISTYRENDTDIYVADVTLSSAEYLQTAFAQNSYGRNVTAKTSETADSVGAILAINGDYYGAQERGYVIRNGVIYRNTADSNQEDLVIYSDGSFEIINESEISAEELLENGAVNVLSFGPALVTNGSIAVSEGEEVGKAMASNPRTAIGVIDDLHYVFVVSDGRTSASEGLSLSELAEFMQSLGVQTAYNLDGGGSSTMYFNGSLINNPTTNGNSIKERSVSDIVYIGY